MNKQEYLLVCLQEECAEVIHAVSKALRFGLEDVKDDVSNINYIRQELVDLQAVMDMLEEAGVCLDDADNDEWHRLMKEKQMKVKKYMKYSKEKGCLTV
jgi:hypothetical protein